MYLLQREVEYLGYQIEVNGDLTAPSNLQAIQQAPSLGNITELKAFFAC